VFNFQQLRYLETVGFYFEAPEGKDLVKRECQMGDPRGGLVELGPIDDVTDLTFEMSGSPWWPCLSHGRVANGRGAAAV
jgi:hypothetical protein